MTSAGNSLNSAFDAIVVGAGIVGCACAAELSQAGLRVALIAPQGIATAATAAAMGHLVALDDSPAQLTLTAYAQTLWQQLRPALSTAVAYQPCGTLWIASDSEELAALERKQSLYAGAGLPSTLLNTAAVATAEPNLRPNLAGGLLVANDAVVLPQAAALYFFDLAQQHGVVCFENCTAAHAAEGQVTLADHTTLTAPHIVLATGADTSLVPNLPLQKRKGQLVLTAPAPGFLHHQIVELGYLKSAHQLHSDSVAFNVQPRSTGEVLIGSSRQSSDTGDTELDPELLHRMLQHAYTFMPSLAALTHTRSWAGVRAATPDKLPYIGPTSDPTIFLAMGFEGLGITSAPAAARLLADQILGRTSALDPTPYLPARATPAQPTPSGNKPTRRHT
jgi:glycine/D-amino acid oxidase-like deaminating enzyme